MLDSLVRPALLLSLLPALAGPLAAQTPGAVEADRVVDLSFDGPTPSWQVRKATNVRVLAQLRTQARNQASPSPTPITAERVVLSCPPGYSSHVQHTVDPLPVIDEMAIEAVIRSNRPGVQLAAEVVLPRSTDPNTNQPRRTLVYGTRYSAPGEWRSLRLDKAPQLVARNARLLNVGEKNPEQQVDSREAYIDRVVLVTPGGQRESLIEIDELTVQGVRRSSPTNLADQSEGPRLSFASTELEGPLLQAPTGVATSDGDAAPNRLGDGPQGTGAVQPITVRRRGSTLTVEGVPLAPRIIEYRGESFELLADLGFNTVWMTTTPSEAQLAHARKAKLWIICPPPEAQQLSALDPASVWQTVLGWSLGLDCTLADLDKVASLAEATRQADPLQRVLLVEAKSQARRYAHLSDVLVAPQRISLGGTHGQDESFEPLPLLGCSQWTSVQAGWSAAATSQTAALAPRAKHLGWHEGRDVRRLAIDALASGSRGLFIRTPERLGGSAPQAKRFDQQLQLINRELALVEPWLVTGKRISAAQLIGSDVETTAWRLGRSRLIYIAGSPNPLPSSSQPPAAATTLLVAGVPETVAPHLLTPAGLMPLSGKRVPGGLRIQLGDLSSGGFVLLADDTQALAEVKRRIGRNAEQVAKAERQLAVAELLQLESIHSQLYDARSKQLSRQITDLRGAVQQCDLRLASRDYPSVLYLARQLRQACARYEATLVANQQHEAGFVSIPTQSQPRLLPTHEALQQALRALSRGTNTLVGGDLESLAAVKSAGWQHASLSDAPFATSVEFTTQGAQQGRACLRIQSQATGSPSEPQPSPEPVVWVTSPQVPATPRSIVEISGWVRVQTPLPSAGQRNTAGKLVIVDTLGEQELSLRIPATRGWQPFRMVRTVTEAGHLQLNFAVEGSATADVDAVMIREVLRPAAATATRSPGGDHLK